jgi:hypothetical protein
MRTDGVLGRPVMTEQEIKLCGLTITRDTQVRLAFLLPLLWSMFSFAMLVLAIQGHSMRLLVVLFVVWFLLLWVSTVLALISVGAVR